jgi:hypothetical protein
MQVARCGDIRPAYGRHLRPTAVTDARNAPHRRAPTWTRGACRLASGARACRTVRASHAYSHSVAEVRQRRTDASRNVLTLILAVPQVLPRGPAVAVY